MALVNDQAWIENSVLTEAEREELKHLHLSVKMNLLSLLLSLFFSLQNPQSSQVAISLH